MRCFSTTVLILLAHGASTISPSKQFFCSFSSDFFPCQLDFSLSCLGRESFNSFHLASEFLVVSYSLTACCECWLPCLHYENIDYVYIYGVRCLKIYIYIFFFSIITLYTKNVKQIRNTINSAPITIYVVEGKLNVKKKS